MTYLSTRLLLCSLAGLLVGLLLAGILLLLTRVARVSLPRLRLARIGLLLLTWISRLVCVALVR